MTDAEIRDAAVAELKLTTAGWRKSNGQPNYPSGTAPPTTHWGKAMTFLDQIGATPPPPPVGNLPAIISTGGTYSGTRTSEGGTTAVEITTSQPVVIENSVIENLGTGVLLRSMVPGAQVVVRNTRFKGGVWRAIHGVGFKSFKVSNCDFSKTWGVRLDNCQSGGTIVFERNKGRDTQFYSQVSHFLQCANNLQAASIEVAWNENINTYGNSLVEDVISMYASSHARIHDNYIQGAYPLAPANTYKGGGIIVGDSGGDDCWITDNQVVNAMNYCVAIAGGSNMKMTGNRGIADSKTPSGQALTALSSGGIGMYVFGWQAAYPITNAHASGNVIGCVTASGGRNDWWVANPSTVNNNVNADNTHYSGSFDHATVEAAEYASWLAKLSANGITIGVT